MILSQKNIEEIAAAVTKDFNEFFYGILKLVTIWSISSRFSASASSLSMTTMTARNMKARLSVWILPSKTSSTTITAKTCPRRSSLQWE